MKNEIKRQVRRQKRNCRKCNQKHKAEKHFYSLSSKRVNNCYSAIGLINNVLKKKKNLNLTTNRMKRKELLSKTLHATTIKTIISREKQQKM